MPATSSGIPAIPIALQPKSPCHKLCLLRTCRMQTGQVVVVDSLQPSSSCLGKACNATCMLGTRMQPVNHRVTSGTCPTFRPRRMPSACVPQALENAMRQPRALLAWPTVLAPVCHLRILECLHEGYSFSYTRSSVTHVAACAWVRQAYLRAARHSSR